jgi:hypothetical protein
LLAHGYLTSQPDFPSEISRLFLLQEELISKLETDLELAETQLQLKEEELEQWKKHVLRLNELSFCSPIPGKLLGPLLLLLIIIASWNARITDRYLDH